MWIGTSVELRIRAGGAVLGEAYLMLVLMLCNIGAMYKLLGLRWMGWDGMGWAVVGSGSGSGFHPALD